MADKLAAYITSCEIGEDELLFQLFPSEQNRPRPLRLLVNSDLLGKTEPNAKGRQYKHGTISAYNAAPCRCQHCKSAYAAYRAQRRAIGKDSPRALKTVDTDGHLPRHWFSEKIWKPALKAAKLKIYIRPHDLRHAHASWLLAGGADLQVVKERLGHASIVTTQKYLHTLPESDDTALDAFDKIRNRSRNTPDKATG
jgi:Phage integrase family